MGQLVGIAAAEITCVSADTGDACDDSRMSNSHTLLLNRMLFHLDAASAFAEELGEARSREIIDSAKREVERLQNRQTSDRAAQ